MKGLFFAKPIEFRVETPADLLMQGDAFGGSMVMANRGAEAQKKLRMEIGLAYGDFRKIKENEEDGLTLIDQRIFGKRITLEPGQERKQDWEFTLGVDCPISSKEGTLFLLYGHDLSEGSARSKIDLRVQLSPVLETLVSSIENHFAFTAKSRAHEDGFTEVKFKPPASYPTLEEMAVLMRLHSENGLELCFRCRVKKFDRSSSKGVTTKTVEIKQAYPREKYLIYNTRPNRSLFKTIVEEVLATATPGKVEKK